MESGRFWLCKKYFLMGRTAKRDVQGNDSLDLLVVVLRVVHIYT